MQYEIELLNNLTWNGYSGKLLFKRYPDGNPALVYRISDVEDILFSVNLHGLYDEYRFGEYRLIAINNEMVSVMETLMEAGIIDEPVFNVEYYNQIVPVCELSSQVIDLLISFGEYYV